MHSELYGSVVHHGVELLLTSLPNEKPEIEEPFINYRSLTSGYRAV